MQSIANRVDSRGIWERVIDNARALGFHAIVVKRQIRLTGNLFPPSFSPCLSFSFFFNSGWQECTQLLVRAEVIARMEDDGRGEVEKDVARRNSWLNSNGAQETVFCGF